MQQASDSDGIGKAYELGEKARRLGGVSDFTLDYDIRCCCCDGILAADAFMGGHVNEVSRQIAQAFNIKV